jgi:hypothetical protein
MTERRFPPPWSIEEMHARERCRKRYKPNNPTVGRA